MEKLGKQMKVLKINQAWKASPRKSADKYGMFVRRDKNSQYEYLELCEPLNDYDRAHAIAEGLSGRYYRVDMCVFVEAGRYFYPIL